MKSTVVLMVLGTSFLFIGNSVNAWGGIYNNRFSPEMLQNMGYGAPHRIYQESENFAEENELALDDELCYGKRCTANEHCCPGSVCVDVDGVMGNCLFAYGRKLGELCRRDADCESGLICDLSAVSGASVCRAPMAVAKQYAEDCLTSSDCDITRGLCCQLQRRHRQTPRKACLYFTDPLTCLGTVQVDQIKQHDVQHTAGEKRITSAFKHVLK
ncbi:prohormone-3 [Sitodiplosis mosellana]|uniref:prohormone-3 n=1 Tax=Sitodiplosis mosellana TaxID=263140 RepID=UPI002445198F|nr:prohormone-3 [Sitodiplosis mosellana]